MAVCVVGRSGMELLEAPQPLAVGLVSPQSQSPSQAPPTDIALYCLEAIARRLEAIAIA